MSGLVWNDFDSQMLPSMELSQTPDNLSSSGGTKGLLNQGGPSGLSDRSVSRQVIDVEDDTDRSRSLAVLNEPSGLIISLP
jgi:hypothetical protein